MVLESTVICVDNSDWMRNGDFIPNRLQAQQEAVNVICRMKQSQNAENTVGLLSLADCQTIVTLTSEINKVMGALYKLEPDGNVKLHTGLSIARLMLKHRQNKNQKMRVIAFIASPVDNDSKELVRLAKKLKKEKVNVDIVSFGENVDNQTKLQEFIEALNGKDGNLSHLVTVPPGTMLADVLMSSPMFLGDDGQPLASSRAGFELGFDPADDPELAMALRVSMEEQRQRHEDETQKVQMASLSDAISKPTTSDNTVVSMDTNESGLARVEEAALPSAVEADGGQEYLDEMTDDEQLAMALQMSLQADGQAMETDDVDTGGQPGTSQQAEAESEENAEELAKNREFLQEAFSNIEGVNPQNALEILDKMSEKKDTDQP